MRRDPRIWRLVMSLPRMNLKVQAVTIVLKLMRIIQIGGGTRISPAQMLLLTA